MSTLAILFSLALAGRASAFTAQDDATPVSNVTVSRVRLVDVGAESMRLGISMLIRSNQHAITRKISFTNVTMNGVPAFMTPVEDRLELVAGQTIALPNEIMVTFYYRDMDSSEPFEKLLDTSRIHVDGMVEVQVELSTMQKIFTMQRQAVSRARLSYDAPVEIPGGDFARQSALTVLRAGKPYFTKARSAAMSVISPAPSWLSGAAAQMRPALLLVSSRYTLVDRYNRPRDFRMNVVGFRISATQFVVPKEAMQPWEFDPEVATLMKFEKWRLLPASEDVIVWTAGSVLDGTMEDPRNGERLSRGGIRVVHIPDSDAQTVVVKHEQSAKRLKLERRVGWHNMALLEFTSAPAGDYVAQFDFDRVAEGQAVEPLAVFRFSEPRPGQVIEPEALQVSGRRTGDVLKLYSPVDSRAMGSPVVSSHGLLAVLQDETSCSFLQEGLRHADGYTPAYFVSAGTR